MSDVVHFRPKNVTLNVDSEKSDGFVCMVCNHWTYINEVSWAEHKHAMFMHGCEPFSFCPACGAEILTLQEWAERFPYDQGKTVREIAREYRRVQS